MDRDKEPKPVSGAKLWAPFAIFLACAAVFIACAPARCDDGAPDQATARRRYSITDKRTILWDNKRPLEIYEARGSIYIKGKSGNELTITAVKTAWADSLAKARETAGLLRISIEAPRDRLTLMTTPGAGANQKDVYADYSLRAPKDMPVTAETEEGEVSVYSMDGPVDIRTASGSVKLFSLKGKVDVRTASGTVEAVNCSALNSIATESGDINIKIPKTATSSELRLTSQSGDISLELEQNLAATIFVSAEGGEIRADSPLYAAASISQSPDEGGARVYKVGGGGMEIRIKTETGDAILNTYAPAVRKPLVILEPEEEE